MKLFKISALTLSLAVITQAQEDPQKPNIVFILADDMGIGDVSHNGGKAATPNIDLLAKQGMRFTDAHTSSSVCTPTRYSCLTGRYNWRTRLKKVCSLIRMTNHSLRPMNRRLALFYKIMATTLLA